MPEVSQTKETGYSGELLSRPIQTFC